MGWDWGLIIICVKCVKIVFLEDKCVLIFPILDPYSSHMALPMWVQHGTLLQIPHESLMGCPCRTPINTHLGPMWVLYFLLAGYVTVLPGYVKNLPPVRLVPQVRTSKYGKNSFKYAAIVLWNSFPDDFRKVSNFNQFKSLISKWAGWVGVQM